MACQVIAALGAVAFVENHQAAGKRFVSVDQGYTGEAASEAAQKHGIQLEVIKHTEAKRGFVLLPRRWVVERSFAWAVRFRRLARDYERLPQTLAGFHYPAFVCLMLHRIVPIFTSA